MKRCAVGFRMSILCVSLSHDHRDAFCAPCQSERRGDRVSAGELMSAPTMESQGYLAETSVRGAVVHATLRKGEDPKVLLYELPGCSQHCINFAARLVGRSFQVRLPLLFDDAGQLDEHPNWSFWYRTFTPLHSVLTD